MNTITTPPTPPSPFKGTPTANHTMTIKIILIALLIIVLIIPILLVHGLISEREERLQSAIEEVHQKWSGSQIVVGPSLTIPYSYQDAEGKWTTRHINCLPEQLEITGTISTKQLQRGIFDIVVYDVPLTIRGRFKASTLSSPSIAPGDLRLADAVLNIGISDLRGIEEQVNVEHNGQVYPVTPGTSPHSRDEIRGITAHGRQPLAESGRRTGVYHLTPPERLFQPTLRTTRTNDHGTYHI